MRNVSQTDIAGYLTDRGANRKLESEPFLRSLGWFPTLACFVIDTGIRLSPDGQTRAVGIEIGLQLADIHGFSYYRESQS